MRSFAFALLAATTAAVTTPVLAQDGGSAPFTGAHVEAIGGWDQLNKNGHGSDILYGLGGGYDARLGGAVVGIEGEVSDSNVREHQYNYLTAGDRLSAKAGRDLYIGGRIGKVVGGRTLLYAKAGYTNARVGLTYDDGTQAGLDNFRYHKNLNGARVGAGAEYALSPNSFLKAEYRYSNYEQGFTRNQVIGGFGLRF